VRRNSGLSLLGILLAASTAAAQEPVSLDEVLDAFGMNLETAKVTSQKVGDGLHVLFGAGGNVAVSIGDDGVLIVDDQFPQIVPKLQAEIRKLGGGEIDYVINTHWHFDHAEGNLTLGPAGSTILSQANSRDMMQADHVINLVSLRYMQRAYPVAAHPTITFERAMRLYFNGERIDLLHFGAAHTTGDTAVLFRGRNAVHLGDVYNESGYPFIDADNGGSLDGVIAFCEAVLAELDEHSVVIPGHGPVSTHADFVAYIEMLKTIRGRISALIDAGATLADVIAAKPTAEYNAVEGDPGMFVDRAYVSLKRAGQHSH